MQQPEPPKIEFPCDYPIKVLGRHQADFEVIVLEIVERHAPGFDRLKVRAKMSRKSTFSSINLIITATGPEQLNALHKDLMAVDLVKMVI